jgi:TonB family protein
MRRAPLPGLAFWLFVYSVLPLQVHPQQPSAVATIAYRNNGEGLLQLLSDMLVIAKKGDIGHLRSMIREMEIPDYQSWFTKNFGQEKGESWAEPYGRWLITNEKDFEELMLKLAHMDGEFAVEKLDTAKRYDLFNGPLDGYIASWKDSAAPKGKELVTIADFFFVEGKFRWDSTIQYFPFQKPTKRSIVPAKLVKKVQPAYPAEARESKIEGTVKLQVVVQKDGSVTVQNVVEGDPILSPAAIEAVKQWRYEPTLLDGKPIDMETTIEVTFTLKP